MSANCVDGGDFVQSGWRQQRACSLKQIALEHQPKIKQLGYSGVIWLGHKRAPIGVDGGQPFCFEQAECLPNGNPTDAEA